MINKLLLVLVLVQCIATIFLFLLLTYMRSEANLIPSKIDMLVDASQDKPPINLSCPECPDYTKEFKEIKKAIKNNRNQQGVYYYYSGGCK
jgi:hypothetical protein